ncbi:hypothetical protein MO973_41390 [Paenibacillus sp. TRM 82003]|uniref:hypothetical protein n=1 Tax=Kineococcus sp. TRM81007 TaxID=2925831 RepID=UPI001F5A32EF|nr:hypothetical protein [Kineococcus sp. TRM81007]MCI2237825.1 hypothetical protein [Kineococcus sp. TRM81007]MCI3926648.1 hypothetical protein [Paenibacillus sp. TRM 82003]
MDETLRRTSPAPDGTPPRPPAGTPGPDAGHRVPEAGAPVPDVPGAVPDSPALRTAFRLAASLRRGKAVHTRGAVVAGEVVRHGLTDPVGVPWVDEPGTDRAVVRLSRAAGVPRPLPDVLGLAVRVSGPDGEPRDLLLSTTFDTGAGRRLLRPALDHRSGTHSSVAAFRTPTGPLLAGARWRDGAYTLAVAAPRGPWRPFARLHLHQDPATAPDRTITFDPGRYPVPGLEMPAGWLRLREPAYAGSRAGRSRHDR